MPASLGPDQQSSWTLTTPLSAWCKSATCAFLCRCRTSSFHWRHTPGIYSRRHSGTCVNLQLLLLSKGAAWGSGCKSLFLSRPINKLIQIIMSRLKVYGSIFFFFLVEKFTFFEDNPKNARGCVHNMKRPLRRTSLCLCHRSDCSCHPAWFRCRYTPSSPSTETPAQSFINAVFHMPLPLFACA